ncbi:MAG: TonB-dependent receptor [Taibaiella sp.]|nr:TonB-dependent receptor [Taibaiella sp.]
MKLFLFFILLISTATAAPAQTNFVARVKDAKTNEPLPGVIVNITNTATGTASDAAGIAVLTGLADGRHLIHFHAIGYKDREDTIILPMPANDTMVITLETEDEDLEEVTVSTTRSSRTIQDVPTRIELISRDELEEKANMKPGDIKMILSESTGIQTLQTSAISGNTGIRIQGMDGRYTQILKDGFPLYAGFSGGLGLMQTPPLDLKRVEIIKGASSTLYGGGSIAGLINLISKTPSKERELNFILNGTTAGGLDANGFYSKLFGKTGITVYAAFNGNKAYAPDNTPFTAIPMFNRVTLHPQLFIYPNDNTDIIVGINGMYENRVGGDINYVQGNRDTAHTYHEDNKTERISSVFEIKRRMTGGGALTFKNSFDHFNRIITTPDNAFDGTQSASFSEINYARHNSKMEWIAGANVFTDRFNEKALTIIGLRNYKLSTYGLFIQNTWDISKSFVLETGLRGDYVNNYGFAPLPKVSVLFKHGSGFSSRLGGGLGYKAPTIFTEESERISYRNVLAVKPDSNKLEHSYGANWDMNYKTSFANGKITMNVNQLFFYTTITTPLLLTLQTNDFYRFENSPAHIDAKGAETNIKIGYKHLKLFLGYTYTHSHKHNQNVFVETPLTPRHHTNSVLMYEVDGKIKIGVEAYYYSPQHLSDGYTGKEYWLCGFMAEKIWKKCSIYINFENMLDSRQTRFDSIYTGTVNRPAFRDIYAPLDGFIANGGIKIKL